MRIVVAIDGPSGSGKSTVARGVANRLGFSYLDTGAMYRAAAWWARRCKIDLDDQEAVAAVVKKMPLTIQLDPQNQRFLCAGEDISREIRTSEISKIVSKVAVNLSVRAEMKRLQRAFIMAENQSEDTANNMGIVAEGRDITTVVAPDAQVRILLTASAEARLARRAKEIRGNADESSLAATRDEVLRRDRDDSTVAEFMTAQDGVVTIDSSNLTIKQVEDAVIKLVKEVLNG